MSETETGRTITAPMDTLIPDERGLTAWKAVFDKINVDRLPDGSRYLRVILEGQVVYQRMLGPTSARHLAALLS